MRRGKGARQPATEYVAGIVQRLAVLLAAGVAPAVAWGHLSESLASMPDEGPAATLSGRVLAAADAAASEGGDVPGAIAGTVPSMQVPRPPARRRGPIAETASAWLALGAALHVATETGAPLAGSLGRIAATLRDLGHAERDRAAALAGPRATARTVLALPAIGILLGVGLGFDTLHVLFATIPGLGCLLAGIGLLVASALWNRALLNRAEPDDRSPGLPIDLLAIAMSGGASVPDAQRRVRRACERFDVDSPDDDAVKSVLLLAESAGVGTVELLRAEAEQRRLQARSDAQAASAALGVRLMIPLGVCVLPAFLLLSVTPLVLSIVTATLEPALEGA